MTSMLTVRSHVRHMAFTTHAILRVPASPPSNPGHAAICMYLVALKL